VKNICNLQVFFFHYFISFFDVVWEIPEVRKIQQRVFKFLIPLNELHEMCLKKGVMVFTRENICNLHIFFFHYFISFHDVVWEIPEVRKIQQWVFKFLIPLNELQES